MAIDFTLPPDVEEIRSRVRTFMDEEVRPRSEKLDYDDESTRNEFITAIIELRIRAKEVGLFLPQMPKEWGGLGLGATAMAFVQAEASRASIGSFVLNCQAPDEGNMHTLLHFGTDYQKEKYLKPLCEGWMRSCFSMTEPEVPGSDPTGIQTRAEEVEGGWVINGHKWFTSGARGANMAIVIACTDPDAATPQARNTAFIVDLPAEGFEIVRDIETMAGRGAHSEIIYNDVFVPAENLFGGRGQGHRLGQVRLGPARLAHCMRWIGQAELALEMMIDRAQKRQLHGAPLADKQGIQWLIADSAMELYAGKLMVLHAAYKIENDLDFRQEVSFAKHHVANMLWRIIDRAIQVHGALGYSADTPLQQMMKHARSARLVDGADEVHQWRIADLTMKAYSDTGSVRKATGDLGF
ncbi:MAG: acyl-CoA dehydrogenase family protein [Actinomycetota bacterium]